MSGGQPALSSAPPASVAETANPAAAAEKKAYEEAKSKAITKQEGVRFELIFPVFVGDDPAKLPPASKATIIRLMRLTELRKLAKKAATQAVLCEYMGLLTGLTMSIRKLQSTHGVTVKAHVPVRFVNEGLMFGSVVGELGFFMQKFGEIVYWNSVFQLNRLLSTVFAVAHTGLVEKCPRMAQTDVNITFDGYNELAQQYACLADFYTDRKQSGIDEAWHASYVDERSMTADQRRKCARMKPDYVRAMLLLCGGITTAMIEMNNIGMARRELIALHRTAKLYQYSEESLRTVRRSLRCIDASGPRIRSDDVEELCIADVRQAINSVYMFMASQIYLHERVEEDVAAALLLHETYDKWFAVEKEEIRTVLADMKKSEPADAEHARRVLEGDYEKTEADTRTVPTPPVFILHIDSKRNWPGFSLYAKAETPETTVSIDDVKPASD